MKNERDMDSSVTSAQSDYAVYRRVIGDLLNGQEQLPSLPSITFEIRKAMGQQDLSMMDLSKLLAKDPALSAVLIKYASSPLVGSQTPPQNLLDVIRLLGMNQVERITMVHSVKSLFSVHSVKHKRLFMEAWRRLALKASVSTFIAKHLHFKNVLPDNVLMAALLSEVGTLAVLSAFKNSDQTPDVPAYVTLCREYAKSLGVITLKQWQVDEQYVKVMQQIGNWKGENPGAPNLVDLINLGLYHSLKLSNSKTDLPPIQELTAFQKLEAPDNSVVAGGLTFVMTSVQEIKMVAKSLF
ncbi:HDOD domain-containing protein [Cellvibrio sp. NN19]|uniref:HDOD domain-containing protein n=1 Tax=Cellvibrio chitinivorans TaxID=3102792 RepID=UPI002B405C38|nr:HDOD domain-containing protein [Cellvibrio sp. NN19]